MNLCGRPIAPKKFGENDLESKEQGIKTADWWTLTTPQGNTRTFGVFFMLLFKIIVMFKETLNRNLFF